MCYAIALLAGLAVVIQAGVNSELKLSINNPILTALLSFCVGTIFLFMYILLTNRTPLPSLTTLAGISWWKWTGGLLGAIYITAVIIVSPRIGAANTIGFIVAGQLIAAVIFDHFGWIGFPVKMISLGRIAGVALLIAGVYLIRRF